MHNIIEVRTHISHNMNMGERREQQKFCGIDLISRRLCSLLQCGQSISIFTCHRCSLILQVPFILYTTSVPNERGGVRTANNATKNMNITK
jgi:hypothetical protein